MDRRSQGCDRSVPPPPGSVKDESRQFLKISLCCEIHTPITLTEGALHPSSLQLYSAPPSSSPSAGSTGGGSTGSPAASSWSGDICKPANISFARQHRLRAEAVAHRRLLDVGGVHQPAFGGRGHYCTLLRHRSCHCQCLLHRVLHKVQRTHHALQCLWRHLRACAQQPRGSVTF